MKILSFDAEKNIIQINKKLKTLIQVAEFFILGMILNITIYLTYPTFQIGTTDKYGNRSQYIKYVNSHFTGYRFWFLSPYNTIFFLTVLFIIAITLAFFYYVVLGIVILVLSGIFVYNKYISAKKWLKKHWKVKILIPKIRYVDKP